MAYIEAVFIFSTGPVLPLEFMVLVGSKRSGLKLLLTTSATGEFVTGYEHFCSHVLKFLGSTKNFWGELFVAKAPPNQSYELLHLYTQE